MVKIKDDYIEIILPEDLEDLRHNESIEIGTNYKTYKVDRKQIITITDDDIKFLHYGEVVDLDYENIKYIYKIKHTLYEILDAPLILDLLGIIFIVSVTLLISVGGC